MSHEHVDVLIVGAGISGVGAACRVQHECPGRTFAVLESRGAIGGTWDLFRFPGIRSDSDMYTLSYPFQPWSGAQAIADGASILEYIRKTARDHRIEEKIRFNHRVLGAAWSTADARWTVDVERTDTNETFQLTCNFLYSCTGYYRYEQAYTPEFEGMANFGGEIVHPQFWTDDIDYAGKRVVVIGSGATAVTIVPAMAETAAHVTQLQRSPSYLISVPAMDPIAGFLCKLLPDRYAYPIVRWKNVLVALAIFRLSRRRPHTMKALLRKGLERRLPPGFDIDKHFKPSYDPWDQRMCIVPDGDYFDAVTAGKVSIVTDHIRAFTEKGIALESGDELEADLIVTATGLDLIPFGGMGLEVDGAEVKLGDTIAYEGMQISGVPNFAFAFGYTNQSWTLGADLTSAQLCKLLNHMERNGYSHCTPRIDDPAATAVPFADLSSGYVLRAVDKFPKQGKITPWRREQNYARNRRELQRLTFDDPALEFSRAVPAGEPETELAA